MQIHKILLLAVVLIVIEQAFAQTEIIATSQNETRQKQILKSSTACPPEYISRVDQIRVYLEKVKSYQDPIIRGKATIDLNALIWKCDADFAKSSFLSLWQIISGEIESAEIRRKNNVTTTQEENKNLIKSISINRFLQQYLISKLKVLDEDLSRNLSKNLTSEEKGFAEFLSLEADFNGDTLSQQQLKSVREFLRTNPISLVMYYLYNLRKQNPQISDQIFTELLSFSQNNPNLTFNNLMELGTYLYTSRLNANTDVNEIFYSSLPVTGIGMVIDLTVERPDIPRNLKIPYLNLVIRFLLNPASNPIEKTQRYIFGRIMLTHFYDDAPELTTLMFQALQIHSVGIPDNFKEESFYERFRNFNTPFEPDYYDKNLEEIENTVGSDERDDKAVRLAGLLYLKGQYERIEKVASYISNVDKRNLILDVTNYTQTLRLIENNKLDEADAIRKKITDSSLKALVGFRFIQALQTEKNNNVDVTNLYIYDVIKDAEKSDSDFSPIILLALAKTVYKQNEGLGYDLITTAVKKLNKNENWTNPKWRVEVPVSTLGPLPIGFSMKKIKGMSFIESLSFLINESKTNLEEVVLSIKNEKIQSEGFRRIAKHYLREVKRNSKVVEKNAK
ncbi:MAG: hypothetical protein ACR2F2_13600 [Pyrinomonadaceae bacterium]